MTVFLFSTLIMICLCLLIWGISRQERVYQYPFFMSAIFFIFIIPQAYAIVFGDFTISHDAINRMLIMSCLCLAMCWIGYQFPVPQSWLRKTVVNLDDNRLQQITFIYVLVGLCCWLSLFMLPDDYGLKLTGQSTGLFTIYFFFARTLTYLCFVLTLIQAIRTKKSNYFWLLVIETGLLFYRAFFFGRRTDIGFIVISLGICLYFVLRKVPPKALVISALIFAMFMIPFIGEQRGIYSEKWQDNEELSLTEPLQELIQGKSSALELYNAAQIIDVTVKTSRYGWGTAYLNHLVFRYIPAQFLGKDFKNSLYLSNSNYYLYKYLVNRVNFYKIPLGSTPTGIGDAFTQFDYFGCLFFAIVAFVYKFFWYASCIPNNKIPQIIYASTSVYAIHSVTHGTVNFLPDLLSIFVFTLPIIWFCKIKNIRSKQYRFKYSNPKQLNKMM